MDPNALNVYTDGSSYNSPRKGGIGILFIFPEHLNKESLEICPFGYKQATNNQMELKACITALAESSKLDKEWTRIVIHTDSSYVVNNYNNACYNWRVNGWTKKSGEPVCNVELWKEFLKAIQKTRCSVDIKWVKGHSKDENNKKVDTLAKRSSRGFLKDPLKVVIARRKMSKNKTSPGSVKMLGQRIRIRIISGEYLKSHNLHKYRYEVVSKGSEYVECVDFIYSEQVLRAGHKFEVRLNSDQNFPQVVQIYKDITEELKENEEDKI